MNRQINFPGVEDMELYHPVPFGGSEEIRKLNNTARRLDCDERFDVIHENYGSFKDKSLIDIGCANGFFLFRFMQCGGREAYGVDTNDKYLAFLNHIAKAEDVNVVGGKELPERDFDVCIFIDLYHKDNETVRHYPDYIGKHCKTAFVSHTNNHGSDIKYLLSILEKYYKDIKFIYKGFQDREIYKCSNEH